MWVERRSEWPARYRKASSSRLVFQGLRELSCPLEPSAGAGDGNRLIHNPLPDAEVLIDPFGYLLIVAGDLVSPKTRSGSSQKGSVSASLPDLVQADLRRISTLTLSQSTASSRREWSRLLATFVSRGQDTKVECENTGARGNGRTY